jgi:hypothetical protein
LQIVLICLLVVALQVVNKYPLNSNGNNNS